MSDFNAYAVIQNIGIERIMQTIPFSIQELLKIQDLNEIPKMIWHMIGGFYANATKAVPTEFRTLMHTYGYRDYTADQAEDILKKTISAHLHYITSKPKITFQMLAEEFKDIELSLKNGATIITLPDKSAITIDKRSGEEDHYHDYYMIQYITNTGTLGAKVCTYDSSDEELHTEVYRFLQTYYTYPEEHDFYFTFGSDRQFPYQYGYVTVRANSKPNACHIFNTLYPPRNEPDTINCAFIYDETQFRQIKDPGVCHAKIKTQKIKDTDKTCIIIKTNSNK